MTTDNFDGYHLTPLRDRGPFGDQLWLFSERGGAVNLVLTREQLTVLHRLTAYQESCTDADCPCWEDGHRQGLETPRTALPEEATT